MTKGEHGVKNFQVGLMDKPKVTEVWLAD